MWLCATAAFFTASLQIAAPLHARTCMSGTQCEQCPCPDASDAPPHDKDKCAVCQFLFGLSGKTLSPTPINDSYDSVVQIPITFYDNIVYVDDLPLHIIPRAPPV